MQFLHQKYDLTIRIALYEVAINDPKIVRKVHAFDIEFRKRQQPGIAFNIFSLSDPKMHRTRQRLYTQVVSQETLQSSTESAVRELSEMAAAGVKQDAMISEHRTADLLKRCLLFDFDVVHQVVYDNTNELMANHQTIDEIVAGFYLQRMNSWALFCFPLFLLGRWLSPLSATLCDTFRVE